MTEVNLQAPALTKAAFDPFFTHAGYLRKLVVTGSRRFVWSADKRRDVEHKERRLRMAAPSRRGILSPKA